MKAVSDKIFGLFGERFIHHYAEESWGKEIFIMEKAGFAFARAYWFDDDPTAIYLNWLSVNHEYRKRGIGTELQIIREEIGRNIGATQAFLQVDKESWMKEWYKRRGYSECDNQEQVDNLIWMQKSL